MDSIIGKYYSFKWRNISNNNETNTNASSYNSALPVQNVNSSDSRLPVVRVSEMKSFIDNIIFVEGLSQLRIEILTKLVNHLLQMRQELLCI